MLRSTSRSSVGRRRLLTTTAVAGAIVTTGLLLPVPAASAQATPLTAGTTAESWYRTTPVPVPNDPVCPPAGGCLPQVPEVAPPSPYASGTLHVGYSGAAEDSRAYLELNLSRLPFGSELVGGTLTLPVATDPQSGTLLPETAALQACLVSASVPDAVDGAINGAPAADCETSAVATYIAPEGGRAPAFTIDLAPFAEAWAFGTAALALVPAAAQAEGASWHLAFSRRDREAEGAQPITARLRVGAAESRPALPPTAPLPGAGSGFVAGGAPSTGGFDSGGLAFAGGSTAAAPPVAVSTPDPMTAPVAAPPVATQQVVPVAAVLGGSYSYPGVFLLPMLLVAAASWLGRALTRDLTVARG